MYVKAWQQWNVRGNVVRSGVDVHKKARSNFLQLQRRLDSNSRSGLFVELKRRICENIYSQEGATSFIRGTKLVVHWHVEIKQRQILTQLPDWVLYRQAWGNDIPVVRFQTIQRVARVQSGAMSPVGLGMKEVEVQIGQILQWYETVFLHVIFYTCFTAEVPCRLLCLICHGIL